MIAVVIVLSALLLLAVVLFAVARTHRLPGAHARRRPLPHRPDPALPPPPGPRHRADQAHTASISATAVLRALDEQADQLHAQRQPGPSNAARRAAP